MATITLNILRLLGISPEPQTMGSVLGEELLKGTIGPKLRLQLLAKLRGASSAAFCAVPWDPATPVDLDLIDPETTGWFVRIHKEVALKEYLGWQKVLLIPAFDEDREDFTILKFMVNAVGEIADVRSRASIEGAEEVRYWPGASRRIAEEVCALTDAILLGAKRGHEIVNLNKAGTIKF